MKEWFYEFLMVLNLSKKTLWLIIVGAIGYIVISLYGDSALSDFNLSGPLAPMSEVVKKALKGKYDDAALFCFGSFALLSIKQYRKDKKRLNNLW